MLLLKSDQKMGLIILLLLQRNIHQKSIQLRGIFVKQYKEILQNTSA